MIECPKCRFRQPKDQYCASCGIDIVAFKPPPTSLSKRFFNSGVFQIFILLLIATIVAYFIAQSDRPQNWVRKFSYTKKINIQADSISQKTMPINSQELKQPIPAVHSTAAAQANINESPPESTSKIVNSLPDSEKINSPTTELKLIFAEVSRETLNHLINESQRLGLYQSFSDFSAGIITNYKSDSQIKFKELKSEQKKFSIKKPQALLFGKTIDETSEFMGLQANIDIKSIENRVPKGHLNITKVTRTGKIELPIEFEMQKGTLFFINWKVALAGFENETNLFSIPPFQVLQSQDFLNQKTEFIILIELIE